MYNGFRRVKQKPFLISSDFLDKAIDDERKSFLDDYPQHARLINEIIELSKMMLTMSIGRVSAVVYSYITAIPTMSGYITKDLVSSHVKVYEPILKRKVKPDPDIKEGFKHLMMTALQMYPPAANDTATNAIFSLVKDTASSMEINVKYMYL